MYRSDKTGKKIDSLLDEVNEKTIYPLASKANDGLMPKEQVAKIEELDTGVLTGENIRMICR